MTPRWDQTPGAAENGATAIVCFRDGSCIGFATQEMARRIASRHGVPGFWRLKTEAQA